MKTTIILNSESMGKGNDELGKKLMGSFLRKICMLDNKPDAILFYNSAVKLLAKGSSVLDALYSLSDAGVDLIACGTCVSFYELDDNIEVGRVSNMDEIVRTLQKSEKIIAP